MDSDDVGLNGSVSSAESESDGWIGALGSDLPLDDDNSIVDDGVPVSDPLEGDRVSDGGLWD